MGIETGGRKARRKGWVNLGILVIAVCLLAGECEGRNGMKMESRGNRKYFAEKKFGMEEIWNGNGRRGGIRKWGDGQWNAKRDDQTESPSPDQGSGMGVEMMTLSPNEDSSNSTSARTVAAIVVAVVAGTLALLAICRGVCRRGGCSCLRRRSEVATDPRLNPMPGVSPSAPRRKRDDEVRLLAAAAGARPGERGRAVLTAYASFVHDDSVALPADNGTSNPELEVEVVLPKAGSTLKRHMSPGEGD